MTIDELDAELMQMASDERADLRKFLERLIEFTDRGGPLAKAYPSLYAYCRERLKLSEGESFRRMQATYKAKDIPEILDFIQNGKVNLTTINILSPHLTKKNALDFLERSAGKGRREVEALVAGLSTKEPPRDVIRITPASNARPAAETGALFASLGVSEAVSKAVPEASMPPAEPTPEPTVRIGFTASKALLEKLERAKGLLRHKHPEGRLEHVFDEALEALLDRLDRSRYPDPSRRPVLPGRRRIPDWVKKFVWDRDAGRCAFESVDGRRCEAAEWLEYDHVTPFALGGPSDDPDNVRLLCRAHNQHRAREDFGDAAWTGGSFGDGGGEGGSA